MNFLHQDNSYAFMFNYMFYNDVENVPGVKESSIIAEITLSAVFAGRIISVLTVREYFSY